jgi:4-amino-4-deoxy-L-arabinose transferase-like glycosyltransferase
LRANSKTAWAAEHPRLILGFILLACLGPFLGKAVHWDDSLFVWTAQHIQKHPVDFFGFDVNWWYSATPMWVANCNPPLFSYLLALVGTVCGWSEIPLHLAGLGLAYGAALGIYELAQAWCERPLLATLIAIFTPAFLVSATTLMCDITMLGFWIWALVCFERGWRNGQTWRPFAAAGLLAGLALLTKYSVVVLLPLFLVSGLMRARKPGWWLSSLAVPLVMLAGYEWLTCRLYGRGLFLTAIHYAHVHPQVFPGGWTAKGIVGLAFAGGSLLPLLFFAPSLWRWRNLATGGAVILGGLWLLFDLNHNLGLMIISSETVMQNWGFVAQVILLTAAGVHLILLVVAETWRRRDVTGLVLGLWIASGLLFATELNWTVNARSILPFVPAVAILLVRRMDSSLIPAASAAWSPWPLLASAAVALSLVLADFNLANAGRAAAEQAIQNYSPAGHQTWFEGHDSFQYYMEKLGAKPLDVEQSLLQPGDLVVVPQRGLRTSLPAFAVGWVDYLHLEPYSWMNLMGENKTGATGFYAAFLGPVPFCLGSLAPQNFFVLKVFSRVQFDTQPANPEDVKHGELPALPNVTFSMASQTNAQPGPEAIARIAAAQSLEAAGKIGEAINTYRAALKAQPDDPFILNNLAWILATSSQPQFRDAKTAVRLAARAADLTANRSPVILGTLAAAFAEDGQFTLAGKTVAVAASLADITGQTAIAEANRKMASLFASDRTVASASGP